MPIENEKLGAIVRLTRRARTPLIAAMAGVSALALIAVSPTYASIGAAAPVMLGIARIIQGLSLGGEYGASATYLTEVADEQQAQNAAENAAPAQEA